MAPLLRRALLAGVLALLTACAAVPLEPRYYLLLDPAPSDAGSDRAAAPIELGVVSLPDYLATRGIVVAVGMEQVRAANQHRWAEPLDVGVARYLGEALRGRLAENGADAGREAASGGALRLDLTIQRLHGSTAGPLVLTLDWVLRGRTGEEQAQGRFVHRVEQRQPGYPALVQAHRAALDAFAAELPLSSIP
ncbi:MAG: PqiC family protein [Pseudomonadota bacterium]